MTVLLPLGALLVVLWLLLLEWRRPNRRHLRWRLVATVLAVAALALLARPVPEPEAPHAVSEAVLWTAGSSPAPTGEEHFPQFALPDATGAPPQATILPDVGLLRRRCANLQTLQVFGDGLDQAELSRLGGLRVIFHPPDHPAPKSPGVCFLSCPRELPLGEPFVVEGRVAGLPPGASLPVSLEAPDGDKTEAPTTNADSRGEATFRLQAPPLPAAGRFEWQLRVGSTTEPLGVSVVAPTLPRVLVLEGEPHFDTAALRRWFEAADGTFTVRTQVGKENARFAAAQTATPFATVDAALLAGYDLVLTDGQALATLHPEERAALLAAVDQTGLGLLVRADAAVLPPDTPNLPAELLPLFPWKLTPVGEAPPGEERPVRPRWVGQTNPSEVPVVAAPFALELTPSQDRLIGDREDHALAAAARRGRGQVALTLLRATTRWQRENEQGSFAAYWSFLFSRLARPSGTASRWSLVNGDGGPVFVDHPLELRWCGPADQFPSPGFVTTLEEPSGTTLPLAQNPREPDDWRGTFWPRRAGWHRVTVKPGGTPFNFYVHPASDWSVLQANRRRAGTARLAALSAGLNPAFSPLEVTRRPIPPAAWFALFFLSAGYLWAERRFENNGG